MWPGVRRAGLVKAGPALTPGQWRAARAALMIFYRLIRQHTISAQERTLDMQLAETEDGQQGFVYSPLLFGADPAYQVSKPPCVDGPDLLHKHAGLLAKHVDLGAERRRLRALGCRSYQCY